MSRSPITVSLLTFLFVGACGDSKPQPVLLDAPVAIDAPLEVPFPCDTIAQDCPAGLKCTVARNPGAEPGGPPLIANCRPAGVVPEDGACTLDTSTYSDNCAVGLACSDDHLCRRLCTGPSTCASKQSCHQRFTAEDGVCEDKCQIFVASSCDAGFTCDWATAIGAPVAAICRLAGDTALGAACNPSIACGDDATCVNTCAALCDDTHPCAQGACQHPLADQPEVGFCD